MTADNVIIVVIGNNDYGDCGIGNERHIPYFKHFETNTIDNIISGCYYTLFTDYTAQKFIASGWNEYGECGIGIIEHPINIPKAINYFNKNQIQIRKICLNVSGSVTLWISTDNKLYGNGHNTAYQLGLGLNKNSNQHEPTLINLLSNGGIIKDIQCADNYSIALISNNKDIAMIIIKYWSKSILTEIPFDIIKLIVLFYEMNEIYSTGKAAFGGHGHNKSDIFEWSKIKLFDDKHITQIAAGFSHSLFLEETGILWSSGCNFQGQCGIKDYEEDEPKQIDYFISAKVQIKLIKAGYHHNLAIDINNRLWSWGQNSYGQCGNGGTFPVRTPYLVHIDNYNKNIVNIECGGQHSFCGSDEGKYYFFGHNQYKQCCKYDEESNMLTLPFCVNQTIQQKLGIHTFCIKKASLGVYNTKLIILVNVK